MEFIGPDNLFGKGQKMKKLIESFKSLKKVTWLPKAAAFRATGWIILVLLVFGFFSNYLDLAMQALLSKIL